jgi:hypothetical protein
MVVPESNNHSSAKKPRRAGSSCNSVVAPRLQFYLVGTGRFELPTPRTPSECSTRLSHVPTEISPVTSDGAYEENSNIKGGVRGPIQILNNGQFDFAA